jgi:hypothetical protein
MIAVRCVTPLLASVQAPSLKTTLQRWALAGVRSRAEGPFSALVSAQEFPKDGPVFEGGLPVERTAAVGELQKE